MKFNFIPNILNQHGRKVLTARYSSKKTIAQYLKELKLSPNDYCVIMRGKQVSDLSKTLKKTDSVVITPRIKDPFSLAAIGAALAAAAAWAVANAAWLVPLALAVGSALFAALSRPRKPSFGTTAPRGGMDESSPTYGWDGIRTTQNIGTPIPVVYGQHRVGGNIINQYVNTDGDKSYLNMLLGVCEGEIESIGEVKLNGNPITNFSGIEEATRMGTNDQTVIPNFEDLHNIESVGVSLNEMDDDHTVETTDSDIEALEVHLSLPSGIFSINSETGDINPWTVGIKIEYRVVAGSWATLFEGTISDKSRSTVRRVYRVDGLSPAQYEVKVTRTSAGGDFEHTGDLNWNFLDEIKTDDLIYPNTALYGLRALATDQLSGSAPDISMLVRGRKVSVPAVLTEEGGDPVDWDDYYYNPADDTFRMLEGDATLYWDGETFEERFSANPIWCIRDLILNERFGLGEFILPANFNEDMALEMAKYADEKVADGNGGFEKRFRLDVVLDSSSKALDVISQLSTTYRGMTFFSQGAIHLRIDKPETPVQLFTMGNVIKDSFVEQFKAIKDSPNVVEVQFMDETKDYEQEQVAYIDEEALAAGAVLRKQSIRLFCTRVSQALREARHAVNVAKNIKRTIQFKAGIDAVAIQAGDVFSFAHDLPQWGYSGRILTGSTDSSIVLDRPVVIQAATVYKLMIRFEDDTIEERTVSNTPGTYSVLTVSSAFSQAPAAYAVYSFGVSNIVTKPFRCLSIQRENTLEVLISAVEYIESIYDDSGVVIPQSNYSQLTREIPDVTDLNITESVAVQLDGTALQALDVWWDKPEDEAYALEYKWASVKIYLSEDSQASWRLVGQSSDRSFRIVGTEAGKTYYVKAVTVCANGLEDTLSGSPTATITTVGKTSKPGNVSGFAYSFQNAQILLYWNANEEKDIAGYEIREVDDNWGSNEEGEEPFFRGLQTELTFEVDSREPGTYYIRAFNRSGFYSNASANVTPENPAPTVITGLGADVFFNTARIYWENSNDADVDKYQLLRSDTDEWGGEEVLIAEPKGVSAMIDARAPRSGDLGEVTDESTFVVPTLIGLPDDYFVEDKIIITSGDAAGQERYIDSFDGTTGEIVLKTALDDLPAEGDNFILNDVAFFKVRAVDRFGAGTLTSSLKVEFTSLDGAALDDRTITARKILVSELSALSANMGSLTAGVITGAVMQTASGGERIVYNSSGIFGFNSSNEERLRISTDGSIIAQDLTLVDPSNPDNYSYLSGGSWYFHDSLGNITPYTKRIEAGVANNGEKLVFCGWVQQPKIMVTINEITSYNADFPAASQLWRVYSDAPEWFCTSPTCWGWCTHIHAELYRASGTYPEDTVDVEFNCSSFTNLDACQTVVRLRFQLWASSSCSTDNFCYGHLSYRIEYKCCSAGSWCCCSYTYTQDAATISSLKTDYDVCQTIHFGGDSGCFEVRAVCVSLTWCTSSLPLTSLCLCTRTISAGVACIDCQFDSGGYGGFCGTCIVSLTIPGATPPNVQCTMICATANGNAEARQNTGGYACACSCIYVYGCVLGSASRTGGGNNEVCTSNWDCTNGLWIFDSSYNECTWTNICLWTWGRACHTISGPIWAKSRSCWVSGCLIHCYYPVVCAETNDYMRVVSLKDSTGDLAVLDPDGQLNWLAVGYG